MAIRRCWPRVVPGPALGWLLLLLNVLAPGRASPRLLDFPAPVCAQEGLSCRVKNSTCLDDSWIHPKNLTPSSPKNIYINLSVSSTQHGELVPVLHVEWTLQTDASILYLEGAELSVLQLNTNERLCVKFQFLSMLQHHRKRWRFSFSHFVVDPGQEYEVTVHHLPKPIPDGDPNHKSKIIFVPGKCPSKQPLGTGLWVKQQGLKQQRLTLLHSGCRPRGCCASSRGLYVSKAICPLLYGETPECVGKKILSICAEK